MSSTSSSSSSSSTSGIQVAVTAVARDTQAAKERLQRLHSDISGNISALPREYILSVVQLAIQDLERVVESYLPLVQPVVSVKPCDHRVIDEYGQCRICFKHVGVNATGIKRCVHGRSSHCYDCKPRTIAIPGVPVPRVPVSVVDAPRAETGAEPRFHDFDDADIECVAASRTTVIHPKKRVKRG
jgi:hypothetical protein